MRNNSRARDVKKECENEIEEWKERKRTARNDGTTATVIGEGKSGS